MSQEVSLLDGLLPDRVRWAQELIPELPAGAGPDAGYPDTAEAGLFPEEREHIAQSVAKRRLEFAAVRRCARRALGELGYPPVPILPGEQREPRWPEGVVGSMTHCAGYCAAAVARSGDVSALGIDAEVHAPLPEGVLDLISLDSERERIAALAGGVPKTLHWDRVLFSAKESVYKAWFPLTRRWLGFEEADIELRLDGTFEARLLTRDPGAPGGFGGRWAVAGGLIATAVGEVVG
ncbi:MAG TPA: 4'-phosphopantetheinyl transferase superfamily protein [Actinospica sp.]|nr:4'-phosphopantetheinyl transferase superfamily protein [Actinospica sp.]